MTHGVPVVASRVGGIPEVVRDGLDGYLADLGDIGKMAEYVAKLIANKQLCQEMGARAKEWACSAFAEEPIVDQYMAIYQRVMGG
jgi:glycosyltransferase involved in cell wall biosynthesis